MKRSRVAGHGSQVVRVFAALAVTLLCPAGIFGASPDEALWNHRNLGKAFYENPATQDQAVAEFRKALDLAPDSARERINHGLALLRMGKAEEGIAELERAQKQDPGIPHTWFNLGIAYKRLSRNGEAIRQLEGMAARVPDEPITHYNLGVLYKLTQRMDAAIRAFETAARLNPRLAGPHFQLATAYRQAGRADDARREMATFQGIKKAPGSDAAEDLEWCFYSEIYETVDPGQAGDPGPVDLRMETRPLAKGRDPVTGLALLDADGDGRVDLLAWSVGGVLLFKQGVTEAASGLEGVRDVTLAVPGDLNNDGLADLCVLTASASVLYVSGGGKFQKSAFPLPPGPFRQAVWLDFDHDYDLDLFLLGDRSVLMRNNGQAGFSDQTAQFPFVDGPALAGARVNLVSDTQGMDLIVTYRDRPGVCYRDRLGGKYEARTLASLPAGMTSVAACDFTGDGWTDLAASGPSSGVSLLANDRKEGFRRADAPPGIRGPVAFADLGNRGVSDFVAGGAFCLNRGAGVFGPAASPAPGKEAKALTAADFDGDGRTDLAMAASNGALSLACNRTESRNGHLRVGLEGVKNLRLAPGASVEVKAGAMYQKKFYEGFPLLFGLGTRGQADAVRITWPNGMIQNETRQAANQAMTCREAQRLSGSCPMIFTWNGRGFEFITDVLGVAPLGASASDGAYFPVDHDEYVWIPGTALAPVEGRYEVRVTEELREVSYLDAIGLTAVDHPPDVEVFTNEKFKGPPFPDFRLFGVRRRVYPQAARDDQGRDVLPRLLSRDRTYPDGFSRDYAGGARQHHLDLDFGKAAPDNRAVLVLSGWVDWADGSTFLGASQESPQGLAFPRLQVRDGRGAWQTVIEDMGIPAGKPKAIVVDLTGRFLSASREVRIVTGLCVYWDEVFLSEETAPPPVRLTDLAAGSADLRFRGFSRAIVHPERKQPEQFVYSETSPSSMWNPTPGLYTRYGKVRPLLTEADDRFVVMGSGDELRLTFDADALPDLPDGWTRDFLLLVDGWAKDGDANTAFSQTVEPLPYHAMPQYPYEPPSAYPDDEAHRAYRAAYNTRPALRLIRPLREETADLTPDPSPEGEGRGQP